MRTVVLSGFMGTGKTTVGPLLAARLGVPFVDSDREVERTSGRTIAELWAHGGEPAFRAIEGELAARWLEDESPRVLAFGGGTLVPRALRHRALERSLVVTLTATPETVLARIGDVRSRPNLAGSDALGRARELLGARAEAYAECHESLSTDAVGVDAIVDAIAALVDRDPLVMPLGSRSYAIDVAVARPTLLTDAVARLAPSTVVLVTDSNVQRARAHAVEAALAPLALAGSRVVLPAGEVHKTLASVGTIWDAALGAGLDRDALVVAVGGGVVGDLAGFAAACLLRGLRFVQVPTTLLAMVDASVGGKTGFDHPVGKNLVGAFHQPSAVVVDLDHLTTLPARERVSGLAEVVKIALTSDAGLLELLDADAARLAAGDPAALVPVVRRAVAAKIRVVRDDERESPGGPRALLNLGHTFGHALEAHGGYSRHLHGEAVSIGLVAELRAAAAMGYTPGALAERARELLERLGLPTAAGRGELASAMSFVGADKKRERTVLRLPVVAAPGVAWLEKVKLAELTALGRQL
jgi:3-dehydroquinate synthase